MKFGIMLNHQYPRTDDLAERLDELAAITEAARDADFVSVFAPHHYLASLVTPQPVPVLSRLIPCSGSMQLGLGIYLATLAHPVELAETFATLDQLSRGRLVLGVGAGYREEEFRAFGIDRRTRGPRLAETVEVVKKLWTGEPVEHRGEHFELHDARISVVPLQRPRPPIWVGANSPSTIRRAARIGDAWLASPNVKPRWAKGNLMLYREEAAACGVAEAGRDYPIVRELYVADSDAEAKAEAGPFISNEYIAFAGYDAVYEEAYADMWAKAFLVGSPEMITERIRDLADGGFNHMIFRVNWPGMPVEATLRTVRRFAAEIAPRFAEVPV